MLYKKIIYVSFATYCVLTSKTFGGIINIKSNSASCIGAGPGDICNFDCDIKDEKQNFECNDVDVCNIYCTKDKCLSEGVLNASIAKELNIYPASKDCFKFTNIYLPNNGNAIFYDNQFQQRSYKEMIVHSGINTKSIYIDCTGERKEECKDLRINAETAQFLEIDVANGNNIITDSVINCPQNSSYNGSETSSCIINASDDAHLDSITINTFNPNDLYIYDGINTIYSTVRLTSINPPCNLITNSSFILGETCWIEIEPTANPSIAPTTDPTGSPIRTTTYKPTANPTYEPTIRPTSNPTTSNPATMDPTTSNPTTMDPTTSNPTTNIMTTFNPTTSILTTNIPTYNPTRSPTSNPTYNLVINSTTSSPITSIPATTTINSTMFYTTLHSILYSTNNLITSTLLVDNKNNIESENKLLKWFDVVNIIFMTLGIVALIVSICGLYYVIIYIRLKQSARANKVELIYQFQTFKIEPSCLYVE